ncbi:F-box/WD repeat-containing protein 8 isoform X2 [Artibeus jamaicensis]|uniref:F-box/WD repeat-containing protein 8 isoform X2 n=1 Tax=Artibeus jamaicensis TaxID=9417 RepID=UPI00235AB578|nr:F-box/WD repeat-containing protein 8 isoform X2 [Artibeus jamaicensis]
MDDHSLDDFRRRWQEELAQSQALRKRRRPRRPEGTPEHGEQASGYLALAQGLLEGAGRPPAARTTRAEKQDSASRSRSPSTHEGAGGGEQLVDQLIRDLNEMDDVPFFDIQLPYELAISIFQYLDRKDLGRCAQVSKTWKAIAEDEVLWYRLCQQDGHLPDSSISDYSRWKLIFQECRAKEHMLRTNWKTRKGAVSELEHVADAVLCDVHSHDGVVIAGYTSGDVRVWDTRTWDYMAPFLGSESEEDEPGTQPYVSFVRINNSLAVAAYEDGFLNIWGLRTGKHPIHRFKHDARIQALALGREDVTVATASAFDVVMLRPNEEGCWQVAAEFEVQKLVDYLELVPDTERHPVAVAAAGDLVYLLRADDSARTLHCVCSQPASCLDVSATQAAFGVKSLGWVHEGNKILVYSLEAERCLSKLGNALGDFTCVNLRDSPPSLLVSGNRDRRVRIHDLRTNKTALSLSAHQLGVSAVQMDDWKVVSGGEEGLVSVWDYRMNQKLWEVHSRHPVRHIAFNSHSLITANVPDERVVRSADLDNFTTHRRHQGLVHAYQFSVDQLALQSSLPLCRPSCDTTVGCGYDLTLAFPCE